MHPDVARGQDSDTRFRELVDAYNLLRQSDDALLRQSDDAPAPPPPEGASDAASTRPPPRPRTASFREKLHRATQHTPGGMILNVPLAKAYTGTEMSLVFEAPGGEWQKTHITVPAGVVDGDILRVPERKLSATVALVIPEAFEVSAADVSTRLLRPPWDLALGGRFDVEHPTGTIQVQLPPRTDSHRRLRIRGKGLPARGERKDPGDFFVEVVAHFPEATSAKEKALWERLRNLHRPPSDW